MNPDLTDFKARVPRVRFSLPLFLQRVLLGVGSLPGNTKETGLEPSPWAVSVLAGFPLG